GAEPVQAAFSPDPQIPFAVLEKCVDAAARESRAPVDGLLGASGNVNEGIGCPVVAAKAGARSDPEVSLAVRKERSDVVGWNARRVVPVVPVDLHLVAVVTVQPVLRADPHEAEGVLCNRRDVGLREALVGRQLLEL